MLGTMSAQRLSDKSRRRIERATGLDIVRAWGHGGYTFDFVIAADNDDRHSHGWFDRKTGEWGIYEDSEYLGHYDTCFTELFPTTPADETHRSDASR
jgi:hypothetical protein